MDGMYRMVLHPVNRFILKIVFEMGGRVALHPKRQKQISELDCL
jgi:hypothetical protein